MNMRDMISSLIVAAEIGADYLDELAADCDDDDEEQAKTEYTAKVAAAEAAITAAQEWLANQIKKE